MSVCLLWGRKQSVKPCEFISGESLRFHLLPSPHGFFCVGLVCVEMCEYPAGQRRAGLFSTLLCDWWFAVLVDELMEASLLRLVEGLIHHSPVQVHCRHYSHLTSTNFSLFSSPSPFTSQSVFFCFANVE